MVLGLIVAGCAADQESPPVSTATPDLGPESVVGAWIDAIVAADTATLADIVEPGGLAMLAAVENGYTADTTSDLLSGPLPDEFVSDYWATFKEGFTDFAGIPLQAVEVGSHEEFALGDVSFASVVVSSGDAVTAVMTSRRTGRWRMDLVGSFGPAFAAQLRRMLVNLPESEAGDRVRDGYRSEVIPSLLAALRRAPGNTVLAAELERMALLLES